MLGDRCRRWPADRPYAERVLSWRDRMPMMTSWPFRSISSGECLFCPFFGLSLALASPGVGITVMIVTDDDLVWCTEENRDDPRCKQV